jgi:hypothetical protein
MGKTIKNLIFTGMAAAVLCAGTVSARQLRTQANLLPVCRGACSTTVHCSGACICEILTGTTGGCVGEPRASQKAGKVIWKRMPRRPVLFCSKGDQPWVGKAKQHSLRPLLLPSYAPGPSQPGNCRGKQESSAFAVDVAAPLNHAAARAPACI